jgi:hypothetical protein
LYFHAEAAKLRDVGKTAELHLFAGACKAQAARCFLRQWVEESVYFFALMLKTSNKKKQGFGKIACSALDAGQAIFPKPDLRERKNRLR